MCVLHLQLALFLFLCGLAGVYLVGSYRFAFPSGKKPFWMAPGSAQPSPSQRKFKE